jgi:hypothetical protein
VTIAITFDDEVWDADDIRAIKRTSDQMTIWKRDGDKRIAELEAVLRMFVEASRDRAIYHLREAGHLRVCHELEAAVEVADKISNAST